ncbi:sulfurtransferase TusA family protein [Thiomicrorhabdus arctica]|uniref:sulfurtransferase TusA family protein n=1 Tax=Thiomicrorhabdus arctica TaxID=131540 RepID=UPI0012FDA575|nr:sulfurtransferase TusA family protein [Thiomicrorhabdus arctica]
MKSFDAFVSYVKSVIMLIKLDTKRLACPMPIIKLKKCLAQNSKQEVQILMELTDAGGLKDIPAFCQQQGLLYELVQQSPIIEFKIWRQALPKS